MCQLKMNYANKLTLWNVFVEISNDTSRKADLFCLVSLRNRWKSARASRDPRQPMGDGVSGLSRYTCFTRRLTFTSCHFRSSAQRNCWKFLPQVSTKLCSFVKQKQTLNLVGRRTKKTLAHGCDFNCFPFGLYCWMELWRSG